MPQNFKNTTDIFLHVHRRLPPLVHKALLEEYKEFIELLGKKSNISEEELELRLINLGKKFWPYRRAFFDFLRVYNDQSTESFFIGKLEPSLKRKYKQYIIEGGNWNKLYKGPGLYFFEFEERSKLQQILAELSDFIHRHVKQVVIGSEKHRYIKQVKKYAHTLEKIEKELSKLRELAITLDKMPLLAREINNKIESVEYGLCHIEPEPRFEEIMDLNDFFKERIQEKHFLRNFN